MKTALRRVRAVPVAVCASFGLAVWLMVPARAAGPVQQTPVFRAGTEAVAVDVQVVGKDGVPITTLTAKDFSVNIAGGGRKVATADLVRLDSPDDETRFVPPTTGGGSSSPAPGARAPRVFVIAIDVFSFGVGESRTVVAAAKDFIRQLRKDDLVGMYTFPVGVRISATSDHTAVSRHIDAVVGQNDALKSTFNLTIGEIVDINAEDTASGGRLSVTSGNGPVTRRVVARECTNPNDNACLEGIQIEAQALGFYLEQRITQGVHGLVALVQYLSTFPGRKTVVLLSGGMPMTDRAGGRPDVGDAARLIGMDAAKSNTVVYSVFVDASQGIMTADRRRSDRGSSTDSGRTHALMGRLLDRVANVSGGTMLEVLMGGGEQAYQRILRETASHYLLGVEPTNADRTGEPRRLDVKVSVSGATVRSRQWVVVPKR